MKRGGHIPRFFLAHELLAIYAFTLKKLLIARHRARLGFKLRAKKTLLARNLSLVGLT